MMDIISSLPPIICLMGPTASGKTPLAIEIVQQLPCEIISVDSAMVYKEMDIGTAKPDAETLKIAPHRLINLVDPKEIYSAGHFRQDALREIANIHAQGKIPLLVGGTMMYFKILQQGLANLPPADETIRHQLQAQADQEGWEALHAYLFSIDPVAAKRIHPNDAQRIQRAIEVFQLTGKPISLWQVEETSPLANFRVYNFGLVPTDRQVLHERIAQRFKLMLDSGLIEEVQRLFNRGDLTLDLPSLRSVGYRQVWEYLANQCTYNEMTEKAIAATRQLAKRQLTWLRSWPEVTYLESESKQLPNTFLAAIKKVI